MTAPKTFYVVWNPGGRNPQFRHESFEAAKLEAERLARVTSGEMFYVLQSISRTKRVDVETVILDGASALDDQIPF